MSFFKTLQDLVNALPQAPISLDWGAATGQTQVSQICVDTRNIRAGAIFVAIAGHKLDGHDYLQRAIEGGAVAVVYTDDKKMPDQINIAKIKVLDARQALDRLASFFLR